MCGGLYAAARDVDIVPTISKCNKSLYCVPGLSGSSCLLAEVVWHWFQPWAGGKSAGTHQRRAGGRGMRGVHQWLYCPLFFVSPVMICSKKGIKKESERERKLPSGLGKNCCLGPKRMLLQLGRMGQDGAATGLQCAFMLLIQVLICEPSFRGWNPQVPELFMGGWVGLCTCEGGRGQWFSILTFI